MYPLIAASVGTASSARSINLSSLTILLELVRLKHGIQITRILALIKLDGFQIDIIQTILAMDQHFTRAVLLKIMFI